MKMNINKYLIIGCSLLTGLTFTSCNEDDYDFADTSGEKAMITASTTSYSGSEGETIMLEFAVDKAINQVMDLQFVVQESSTGDMDDLVVGDGVIPGDFGNPNTSFVYNVAPFSETFTVPVELTRDLSIGEGSETIFLNVSTTGRRTGITKDGGIDIEITINDEINDEFVVILDWDQEYVGTDGDTHSFCDFDLDLEIYDNAGNVVADSYASCPESISVLAGDLADGDYEIKASYYTSDGTVMPESAESIPAVVTLAKRGEFNEIVDLTGIWTDFESGLDPNADGVIDNPDFYETVANLNISGTTYTVTTTNGDVIFQGRAQ